MRLRLITVPYRYDEPREGLGLGPDAILDAGLEKQLASAGVTVEAPVSAELAKSDREEGSRTVNIGRLGASTAKLIAEARRNGELPLVLAGDDTAGVGVVAGLQQSDGAAAQVGVVWIDAHGDFNTPETSYSGILAGMTLSVIAGLAGPLWRAAAELAAPVPTDRILLAGTRDLDEKEETLLRSTAVQVVSTDDIRGGESWKAALALLVRRCSVLSVHLDLDILDPHLVPSSTTPSANGLSVKEAAELLTDILSTGKVGCVTINSLNPGGAERGAKSIQSTLELLTLSIPNWISAPSAGMAEAAP